MNDVEKLLHDDAWEAIHSLPFEAQFPIVMYMINMGATKVLVSKGWDNWIQGMRRRHPSIEDSPKLKALYEKYNIKSQAYL